MKFLSKLVLITLITSQAAFADCKDLYKSHKTKAATSSILSTTGAAATTGTGYVTIAVGTILGIFGSNSGFIITGVVAGLGVTGGGVYVSIKGVQNGADFMQKVKAYKLIKESYIGAGDYLNKTADRLSEELGIDISTEEVARLVVEADMNQQYCQNKDSLFGIKAIRADLAVKLQ
jgi:hypothetical protein